MPIIVFSSPKRGAGKTTAATILATELAHSGAGVTIIDADPNRNVADWARLPGAPENITTITDADTLNIVDRVEKACTPFVIIDLEGTASMMVSHAICLADLVIIPLQGSQLDAKQAARSMQLVGAQEKIVRRAIPFVMLLTRTNPAITPRTQRHIETRFTEMQVPVMRTKLYEREAYRAMFLFGGTLRGLAGKGVSNLDVAIDNARQFTGEIIELLSGVPAMTVPTTLEQEVA